MVHFHTKTRHFRKKARGNDRLGAAKLWVKIHGKAAGSQCKMKVE